MTMTLEEPKKTTITEVTARMPKYRIEHDRGVQTNRESSKCEAPQTALRLTNAKASMLLQKLDKAPKRSVLGSKLLAFLQTFAMATVSNMNQRATLA